MCYIKWLKELTFENVYLLKGREKRQAFSLCLCSVSLSLTLTLSNSILSKGERRGELCVYLSLSLSLGLSRARALSPSYFYLVKGREKGRACAHGRGDGQHLNRHSQMSACSEVDNIESLQSWLLRICRHSQGPWHGRNSQKSAFYSTEYATGVQNRLLRISWRWSRSRQPGKEKHVLRHRWACAAKRDLSYTQRVLCKRPIYTHIHMYAYIQIHMHIYKPDPDSRALRHRWACARDARRRASCRDDAPNLIAATARRLCLPSIAPIKELYICIYIFICM